MKRIDLRQLQLEGFGLHESQVTYSFGPGLNVLISPNETGKSTFLSGLLSVLFGLPERSDPEAWGTERFRNWAAPLHFRGEVTLQAGDLWHRIRRDFSTHEVQWTTAPARPARHDPGRGSGRRAALTEQLIPMPSAAEWKVRFDEEHNPGGRGEPVRRYNQHLRMLLGIEDLNLFRLTHCLAQDPEDRSGEEAAFRTKQVPEGIQGLISGSGGQLDEVLTLLFDGIAEITQATGEAGLIRPGRTRPANQRNAGRLEMTRKRLDEVRGRLAAAETVLEDLQGSQERLEMLRRELEQQRQAAEHDRKLQQSWDEWTRVRRQRRDLNKRAVEIDKALRDLEQQQSSLQENEEKLNESFSEYRNPAFPFDKKRRELDALVEAEKERTRHHHALEELRTRRHCLDEQIAEADEEIASRYAGFAKSPHLPRDFEEWQKVATELRRLRTELQALDRETVEQAEVIRRMGHWAALDPLEDAPSGITRPAAKLKELRDRVPRLLSRAEEAQRLSKELAGLEARLDARLQAAAEASEETRREAEAFYDRRALHRIEAEGSARQLQDIQQQLGELENKEATFQRLAEALTSRLGPPGDRKAEVILPPEPEAEAPSNSAFTESREPCPLPQLWTSRGSEIRHKVQVLREEGQLLRRIDAVERGIRAGLFQQVVLPAVAAFLVVGGIGVVAGLLLFAGGNVWAGSGLGLGVVAGALVGILRYRRSRGTLIHELSRAQGRLAAVRRTLAAVDGGLGDLARLDAVALEELLGQLDSFEQISSDLASLRVLAPSEENLAEAQQKAERAEMELSQFKARMAVFGNDPAGRVAEWKETDRRITEIRPRLDDLRAEVGPPDWAEQPLEAAAPAWVEPSRLACIVADLLPAGAGESPSEAIAPPTTGGQVAAILGRITQESWNAWIKEARSLEAANQGVSDLAVLRAALEGGEEEESSRLDRLGGREAELADVCAPFTVETSQEEVKAAAQAYEDRRADREKASALVEELRGKIPKLEQKVRQAEERVGGLRGGLRGILRPALGDPLGALERLRAAADLRAELDHAAETQARVLQSRDVPSLEDLRVELEQVREESGQAAARVRDLEEEFVFLQEISDAEPEQLQRQQADLKRRIQESTAKLRSLEEQREAMRGRAADAEAEGRRLGNAAVLELEMRSLEREEEYLLLEREALRIAFETLREAEGLFSRTHRERLEQRATRVFRHLSLNQERSVQLGARFEIQVSEGGGQHCAIRQLSQGARDQLALSLRLAVAELLSGGIQPPLLFDDPFVTFDSERLEAMRQVLDRLAEQRQVVLLSHRPEMASWGRLIDV